jgi:hypothetical protein
MRIHISAAYIVLFVALVVFIGLLGAIPLWLRWVLEIAVFIALLVMIGREVTGAERVIERNGRTETVFAPGRLDGVLIDARNKISLSRLQLVLWTVIILSAWATLALHRIIPLTQGQFPSSNTRLVQTVAGILAGEDEVSNADLERAAAMMERITGATVTLPDEDTPDEAAAALYDPLDIALPQEVWLALGISVASLAGASIINTNKAANDATSTTQAIAEKRRTSAGNVVAISEAAMLEALPQDRRTALESLDESVGATEALETVVAGLPPEQKAEVRKAKVEYDLAKTRAFELEVVKATAVGDLHNRPSLADARWSDMVRGDTVANFQFTDLGKIQMLVFTIILVFAYAALVWSLMRMPQSAQVLQLVPSMSLPAFSNSLLIIMAISHGGYLTTKTTV